MALRAVSRRARRALVGFLRQEASGGYVLMAAAALALAIANSPLAPAYFPEKFYSLGMRPSTGRLGGIEVVCVFVDFYFDP